MMTRTASEPALALVTGGTGVIGPELIKCLLKRGYRVRALVRRTPLPNAPSTVEIVPGDLIDRRVLEHAVLGADVVFHLAAKLHINDPGPQSKAQYEAINVEGASLLARVAQEASVRRFVFFSTINVYGSSDGETPLTEDSPLAPDSSYAESKVQAERGVMDALPAVILRLAAVYGPNMKGNYPRLVNALQKKRFVLIGNGKNRRTLIHVHDVCQAAILAAEHPSAAGRIYNVTDGQVHTVREVISAICQALGTGGPRMEVPAHVARRAFGLLEDLSRLLGIRCAIGRSTIDKLTEDLAVSGDKIQDELGFSPRYDLISGWSHTLRNMHKGARA